jgi:hypothetical protein
MFGSSRAAAQLAASQEGLSCMKLVAQRGIEDISFLLFWYKESCISSSVGCGVYAQQML